MKISTFPRISRISRIPPPLLRLPTRHLYSSQPPTPSSTTSTTSSTDTPAPPLLLKFKSDLKTALRARDTPRLNVLRGLLADITNASKTASPVKSDMQVLSLLRKRVAAAQEAAGGFKSAGREDLVEKEEAQRRVLEEYMGGVETLGEGEVEGTVQRVMEEMLAEGKADKGTLLKRLIGPGGVFEGKNVDKPVVVKTVQKVMEAQGKK